jgi:membrane-bound lytic murein transglycosylase B
MVLVLSMVLAVASTDAGTSERDAGVAGWRLSQKLGKGSAAREALVAELIADAGNDPRFKGEEPLTRGESEALLDDPRAELIYGAKTVSITAPSMITRQRNDHLDLMKLFLKPERLNAGAAFVTDHRASLERAQEKHGVDYAVIIGILTWESKLGTITGDYRAFNALASQAFFVDDASAVALGQAGEEKLLDDAAQKRRVSTIRARARRNLVALLRQCKARGIDALEVKGSWAGALGFPQFMPASLQWADDGDGDGKIDLFTFDDAIFSIGRYLSEHGFKKDRKRAVWDYNHEDAYVQGVLAYADALRAMSPDGGAAVDAGSATAR